MILGSVDSRLGSEGGYVSARMPDSRPDRWQPIIQEAEVRGARLLGQLHEVVAEWGRQVPGEAVLMDAWKVPLPGQPARHRPGLRYQRPIERLGERIGVVVSDRDLYHLLSQPHMDALMLRLEMVLTELREWAEIEAERRGEKLRLVEDLGLTADVRRLLMLCHLPIDGFPLEVCAFQVASTPFQHMDGLRRFVISRTWRYQADFPWIALTPNGVMSIRSEDHDHTASDDVDTLVRGWQQLDPGTPIRAYRTRAVDWSRLPEALKEVQASMGLAESAGVEGVINGCIEGRWALLLGELSMERLDSVVQLVLGPLMNPHAEGLLVTLQSYLANDRSIARTAKVMYVHPNTVLYRLRRVEGLLGINLGRTDDLAQVFVALKLHQMFSR